MQRRIAKAREFLGETDWPLKQIALHLKFSDVYFFSSQFRKAVGISPAAYRKSRQV
jgi:AraC-like DNA-binding protein